MDPFVSFHPMECLSNRFTILAQFQWQWFFVPIWLSWFLVQFLFDKSKAPSKKAFDVIINTFAMIIGVDDDWDKRDEEKKATSIVNLAAILIATQLIWFLPWLILFFIICVERFGKCYFSLSRTIFTSIMKTLILIFFFLLKNHKLISSSANLVSYK